MSKLRIKTVGSMRVTRADGHDCTPRGLKPRAVLALLALSPPDCSRSRAWLQSMLWAEKSGAKAATNLRQSLSVIRRALGDAADVLVASKHTVKLDQSAVEVDITHISSDRANQVLGENLELLEGLDIGEEAFETWLREQRGSFANRIETLANHDAPMMRINPGSPVSLVLVPPVVDDNPSAGVLAQTLQDMIGQSLAECSDITIRDGRRGESEHAEHSLSLRTFGIGALSAPALRVTLSNDPDNRTIWSQTTQDAEPGPLNDRSDFVLRQVNQAVSVALDNFLKTSAAGIVDDRSAAAMLCFVGIQHFYKLGRRNFQIADEKFEQAYARHQSGVYLAWRAYLRTFLVAERLCDCRQTAIDESRQMIANARELEPNNSLVCAFAANVEIMMNRSYPAALELAKRSVHLNEANAIGWALLGIAQAHLGDPKTGFQNTQFACQIGGVTPYRFHLDGLSCIAGTLAGQLDDAVRAGETSHALSPTFPLAMRYLAVLYLQRGEAERSWTMVEQLQKTEPDFSYDKLADSSYPVAGLRRSGLLKLLPSRQI